MILKHPIDKKFYKSEDSINWTLATVDDVYNELTKTDISWEELTEKAKELGYNYIKERGVVQLYKDFESCRIIFIGTSGNVIVEIPFHLVTYSGILCEHISVDKMYQIMLALK